MIYFRLKLKKKKKKSKNKFLMTALRHPPEVKTIFILKHEDKLVQSSRDESH